MLDDVWVKTAAISAGGLMLAACGNGAVSLTEETWQCQNKQCEVSFVLTNADTNEVQARYAIRAQSAVQTINADLRDGLVVAEIKDSVMLAAGESQIIRHQLEATRPPTNVVFNAWVK